MIPVGLGAPGSEILTLSQYESQIWSDSETLEKAIPAHSQEYLNNRLAENLQGGSFMSTIRSSTIVNNAVVEKDTE